MYTEFIPAHEMKKKWYNFDFFIETYFWLFFFVYFRIIYGRKVPAESRFQYEFELLTQSYNRFTYSFPKNAFLRKLVK